MTTDKARAEAEWLGRKLFNEILYDFKYHGATVAIDKATATIAAALTSHARPAERELARNQPCGCVVCRCEDEHRCGGCGAKNCGTHPVGQIPNPVYKSSALTARDAEAADKLARVEANVARWQHEAEGLREAVRVLAEELIVARGYGLCIKGHETDRIAVTQRNTDANPIAKAALDAAGGAQ